MPNSLAEILTDPVQHAYPVDGSGYTPRAGTWSPPAVVSPEIRAAAADQLLLRDQHLAMMATSAIAAVWVTTLGVLTAGRNMSVDDAKTKALAYAAMIADQYPAAVLTQETLRRAAAAFKFFPSFSEVAERLDLEVRKLKREREKLAQLAAEPKPAPTAVAKVVAKTAATISKPAAEAREPILSHPLSKEEIAEMERACDITP